ncbi:hypothetical protein BYT27DRAFT_7255350 [Phlegmacium glaucopus]|nr:hypothetical protein BYT27DRAFT_7255350 [Phlegmacium glaucopus]
MRQSLNVSVLGHHIDPTRNKPPDKRVRPTCYDNWLTNDLAIRAFLEMNCSEVEQEFIQPEYATLQCWEALQTAHLAVGPIKQMELIRAAFNTRIPRDRDQDSKVQQITEDIRRVFDMPQEDSLSNGHEHLRAIIQRDLQNAIARRPFLSHHNALYIASDTQLLLGDASRTDAPVNPSSIALAAKATVPRSFVQISKKTQPHRPILHRPEWWDGWKDD